VVRRAQIGRFSKTHDMMQGYASATTHIHNRPGRVAAAETDLGAHSDLRFGVVGRRKIGKIPAADQIWPEYHLLAGI
jgi:hypothetical protein